MLRVSAPLDSVDDVRGCVVVLAGPGVVDDDAVDGLRAFAGAGNLGVANTWGAKGVFAWDSPHHLGTCGLQALDFELLGFGDADAIVTTGLDPDESPPARIALAPTIDVAPGALAGLAGSVRAESAPVNDLYSRLAAVAQPGYAATKVPLHPARAVADLGAVLPSGGLVVAEPGIAGLWVARTFPTPALDPGAPRRVVVPARREPGAAARTAVAAARRAARAVRDRGRTRRAEPCRAGRRRPSRRARRRGVGGDWQTAHRRGPRGAARRRARGTRAGAARRAGRARRHAPPRRGRR